MSGRQNFRLSVRQQPTALAALAVVLVVLAYLIVCPAGLLPSAHYRSSSSTNHLTFSCLLQMALSAVVFGLGLFWLLPAPDRLALPSAAFNPPFKPPR